MENLLFRSSKINISFENLCYTVFIGSEIEKKILKNINGCFKSGNITAILGPSGGGKSTLLNILAGYTTSHISGTININGEKRNLNKFYKISRYIMEDSIVTNFLTVKESMFFASRFKLGNRVSEQESQLMIIKSLNELHLIDCQNTLTDNLSSGEKKRLVIALELLDCPSIIFLDEPTTGLDEHNSYECISLLKKLAKQGITVITSIHTPSPKVFDMFDHVYVIAEGQCVYRGIGSNILPFLKQIHLECPLNYNPTDFFIEVASGEYGEYIDKLVELTDNEISKYSDENLKTRTTDINKHSTYYQSYKCSFWIQFLTLLHRATLQGKKNIGNYVIRMCVTFFIIAIMSMFYYKCGNDGTKIKSNPFFLMLSILYFVYATMIPTLSNTPMEIKMIRSECFNKWYDVLPYFLALCVQVLPFMLLTCGLYVVIVYPLTDQPPDILRMAQFLLICVMVSMVTDALCQIIGIIFDPVNSLFLGVCVIQPIGIFAIKSFGHDIKLLPLFYQYLIKTSYMRLGLEALVHTVYHNREHIYCPEEALFCQYSTGDQVMKAFGYGTANFRTSILSLIFFYFLFKAVGFYTLQLCIRTNDKTNRLLMLRNILQIKFNIKS